MFSGFSEGVVNLLKNSWSKGTSNQYHSYLKRWEEYCMKRNIDPFKASTSDGVEFLSHLFHNSKMEYSALNTARSALSTVIPEINGLTFGRQPIVKRLLKGIFRERPTFPKYTITFDVDKVFNYILTMPPPEAINLKQLSLRVATLLCILSGQRSQTIASLTTSFICPTEDKIVFPIASLLKQTRPGFHQEPLEFIKYDKDNRICPVFNIKLYLEKVNSLRKEEKGFFISFAPPHKNVSSKTIARWVLSFLKDCGVDTKTFGAHSTRSASTSKALKVGMTLGDIGKAAGWTSGSVYSKYYNKPIHPNFGAQLLNAHVPEE